MSELVLPKINKETISKKEYIFKNLAKIINPENVLSHADEIKPYETDALAAYTQTPLAVVMPENTQEVSNILKFCHEEDIKVVPRGAGTGLSGGALPLNDAILLSLGKFNKIIEIDFENKCVVTQPGVTNLSITDVVKHKNFYYAPDPSSQLACSIGGNVAENSGGVHSLKYGTTTNNILDVEIVMMDGTICRIGGKTLDQEGYDLMGLICGSEGSLRRLKTDCIDLYQLHWPERKTNFFGKLGYEYDDSNEWTQFEDILGNLQKFIDQGKIKHIGVSNETPWGLSKYLELSKKQKLPKMLSVQNPYNLLNRTYEIGLAEISVREKVGLLAYSPLACGYLSGKYRNNQMPKGTRIERDGEFWTRYNKHNSNKAVDAYYEVAKKHDLDLAQMSLKFLEIQPFVTSVIIGATTMEQLKTNIESVNIKLTDEIINDINEVQAIYPNPCP